MASALVVLHTPAVHAASKAELIELCKQVEGLVKSGKKAEAIATGRRCLAEFEALPGHTDVDIISALGWLTFALSKAEQHAEAERFYRRSIALHEKIDAEPQHLWRVVEFLAQAVEGQGRWPEAVILHQKAESLAAKAFGADHDKTLVVRRNRAVALIDAGRMSEAIALFRDTLRAYERRYGEDHGLVVDTLVSLAEALTADRQLDEAVNINERALAIAIRLWGNDHVSTLSARERLAESLRQVLRLVEAEEHMRVVLAARERARPTSHSSLGSALHVLANILGDQGRPAEADGYYQRAAEALERAFGADDYFVAQVWFNQSAAAEALRDYDRALELVAKAQAIRERQFGADSVPVAKTLVRRGRQSMANLQFAAAEPHLKRGHAMLTKHLGADHPEVLIAETLLANLAVQSGATAKARTLLEGLVPRLEKRFGKDSADVGWALKLLGDSYRYLGDYARAETTLKRALSIYAALPPPRDRNVCQVTNPLAELYMAMGDIERALAQWESVARCQARDLQVNLLAGSERLKRDFALVSRGSIDLAVTLQQLAPSSHQGAARMAFGVVLDRKGRVLDAMGHTLEKLRSRAAPEDRAALERMMRLREELSAQASAVVVRGQRAAKNIESLEEEIGKLERELGTRSAALRLELQAVSVADVERELGDAALVEIVSYEPFNVKTKSRREAESFFPRRYAAYVLRAGQPIVGVDVGLADTIDAQVRELRVALSTADTARVRRLSHTLYQALYRPLESTLGSTRRIIISPDGVLSMLPFAQLTNAEGQPLIERHSIAYVSSGRDLLLRQRKPAPSQGIVVVAAPDFDVGAKGSVAVASSLVFDALPGTEREARAIAALFPKAALHLHDRATERALKSVASPAVLHIATHGYFLDGTNPGGTLAESRGLKRKKSASSTLPATATPTPPPVESKPSAALTELTNPMLRSGLAFAGANGPAAAKGEGILTGLEAASLALEGTQLVVLSACETGVGRVENGEGVYGLRRAFQLAGAQSILMSLWKVDDAATEALMTTYYRKLAEGGPRDEALRAAQLAVRSQPGWEDPLFWAGFIHAGDTDPLRL